MLCMLRLTSAMCKEVRCLAQKFSDTLLAAGVSLTDLSSVHSENIIDDTTALF